MTHEKFIESLNLYLDGELPPAEAANLEREIAGNLEYRRVYRQYCQMQNACAELSERFREEAAPAPHFRKGAVVEIPRRARGDWLRSLGLVASGALAACAVFVVVRQAAPTAAVPTVAANQPAPVLAPSQPVQYTTTVALNGNPTGFRNPWTANNRTVVDFSRLSPPTKPLQLGVPELNKTPGAEALKVDLQPYGTTPGAPLRVEDIEAAAFQYQR